MGTATQSKVPVQQPSGSPRPWFAAPSVPKDHQHHNPEPRRPRRPEDRRYLESQPFTPKALNRRPFRPSILPVRRPSASRIVDACKNRPLGASGQNLRHLEPSKTQAPRAPAASSIYPGLICLEDLRHRRSEDPQHLQPTETSDTAASAVSFASSQTFDTTGPKAVGTAGPGPSTPPIPRDQWHQLSTPDSQTLAASTPKHIHHR